MERLLDPDRPQRSRERSPVASDLSFATARNRERVATSPPVDPPVNLPPVRAQTQNQLQVDGPDNEPRQQGHRDNQLPRRPSHDDLDDERPRRGTAFSYSPIYAPRVLKRMSPAPQPRTTPAPPHTDNLRNYVSPIRDFELGCLHDGKTGTFHRDLQRFEVLMGEIWLRRLSVCGAGVVRG